MPHLIRLKLILLLLILPIGHHAHTKEYYEEYTTDKEVFEIPGYGEISMTVPRSWNYRFTKTDELNPPVITFYIAGENNEEIFQLNISMLWDDGYKRNVTSQNFIRSFVEKTGEAILALSDETDLLLDEISGTSGSGFLYNLTDSSASKGEYKYLTQGALSVGEVLLVFSLFSNDAESLLREATIKIVKSAKHYFRKDI